MSAEHNPKPDGPQAPLPVIEMRDVTLGTLRDPGIIVAEGVDWRVQGGEFWAVGGLHGTGKSDFLMLAGGVMAPVTGRYEFLGEAMPIFTDERLAHRLKLGLVFDNGRLFNALTVAENVALPLRYHRNLEADEAEPLVRPLLELVGLEQLAQARPGSLNRNWQRRAALARALILRPELLLLDAPLAGLDPRQQGWWFDFLDGLSRGHPLLGSRPMTIVLTTESLRPWRGHATRFAMLNERRFTALGDWADVEHNRDPLVSELAEGG